MLTKSSLFLACCALLGTLLFETGQTRPVLAAQMVMATQSTPWVELKSGQSTTPTPTETVIISISGTTNSCAQIVFVRSTGSVVYISCLTRKYTMLPISLINTFFSDINIALPLNTLPQNHGCLKSVSFGSSIYLTLQTQKSPDVSCSIDHLGHDLYIDVKAIQNILHATPVLPPQ